MRCAPHIRRGGRLPFLASIPNRGYWVNCEKQQQQQQRREGRRLVQISKHPTSSSQIIGCIVETLPIPKYLPESVHHRHPHSKSKSGATRRRLLDTLQCRIAVPGMHVDGDPRAAVCSSGRVETVGH